MQLYRCLVTALWISLGVTGDVASLSLAVGDPDRFSFLQLGGSRVKRRHRDGERIREKDQGRGRKHGKKTTRKEKRHKKKGRRERERGERKRGSNRSSGQRGGPAVALAPVATNLPPTPAGTLGAFIPAASAAASAAATIPAVSAAYSQQRAATVAEQQQQQAQTPTPGDPFGATPEVAVVQPQVPMFAAPEEVEAVAPRKSEYNYGSTDPCQIVNQELREMWEKYALAAVVKRCTTFKDPATMQMVGMNARNDANPGYMPHLVKEHEAANRAGMGMGVGPMFDSRMIVSAEARIYESAHPDVLATFQARPKFNSAFIRDKRPVTELKSVNEAFAMTAYFHYLENYMCPALKRWKLKCVVGETIGGPLKTRLDHHVEKFEEMTPVGHFGLTTAGQTLTFLVNCPPEAHMLLNPHECAPQQYSGELIAIRTDPYETEAIYQSAALVIKRPQKSGKGISDYVRNDGTPIDVEFKPFLDVYSATVNGEGRIDGTQGAQESPVLQPCINNPLSPWQYGLDLRTMQACEARKGELPKPVIAGMMPLGQLTAASLPVMQSPQWVGGIERELNLWEKQELWPYISSMVAYRGDQWNSLVPFYSLISDCVSKAITIGNLKSYFNGGSKLPPLAAAPQAVPLGATFAGVGGRSFLQQFAGVAYAGAALMANSQMAYSSASMLPATTMIQAVLDSIYQFYFATLLMNAEKVFHNNLPLNSFLIPSVIIRESVGDEKILDPQNKFYQCELLQRVKPHHFKFLGAQFSAVGIPKQRQREHLQRAALTGDPAVPLKLAWNKLCTPLGYSKELGPQSGNHLPRQVHTLCENIKKRTEGKDSLSLLSSPAAADVSHVSKKMCEMWASAYGTIMTGTIQTLSALRPACGPLLSDLYGGEAKAEKNANQFN